MAAVETQCTPGFTKLELRTSVGSEYRLVSNSAPRDCNADEIPLIDFAELYGDENARKKLAGQIRKAAENTGFLYAANHGIDQTVIDRAYKQAQAFFYQTLEQKQLVAKQKSKHFNGFFAKRSGHTNPNESLGAFLNVTMWRGTNIRRLQRVFHVAVLAGI